MAAERGTAQSMKEGLTSVSSSLNLSSTYPRLVSLQDAPQNKNH